MIKICRRSPITSPKYREELFSLVGKTFSVLSTVDHPYVSPPIRLLGSHRQMLRSFGTDVLLCIWDINYLDIDRYKYELVLDFGLLGSKMKDFFIFTENELPSLQRPKMIDFSKYYSYLKTITKSVDSSEELLSKSKVLISLYSHNIKTAMNGTDFYIKTLSSLYRLIKYPDLANYFTKSSLSYYSSPLSNKWISYCIQETM